MPTGKVKWFDPKKGYGFIIGEQGQDVFVHYTSISGTGFRVLKDGEEVAYDLVKGEKGFQARNVARSAQAAPPAVPPAAAASQQPAAN
jgi:cold shock protein